MSETRSQNVEIHPISGEARFSLRVTPDDAGDVGRMLGVSLPLFVGTTAATDVAVATCLGPDEWMLFSNTSERVAHALAELKASRTPPFSLVDVSDRECGVEIFGPQSTALLACVCPLDCAAMAEGTACRTLFERIQIVLLKIGRYRFRLYYARSYSPHVDGLLAEIVVEFAAGL